MTGTHHALIPTFDHDFPSPSSSFSVPPPLIYFLRASQPHLTENEYPSFYWTVCACVSLLDFEHFNCMKCFLMCVPLVCGLPRWCTGKESACQCRRCRFDPWIRKTYPLEKEMATHSSILARKICGRRSLSGCGPWGHKSWTRLSNWTSTASRIQYVVNSMLAGGLTK